MLSFKDKVIVVTGAGNGLGKDYALFFASRGAKVMINDLSKDKNGRYSADIVKEEIVRKGGIAESNYDSVTEGDKIIDATIKAFGRIDVLINNAGILRDSSFKNMTDKQWKDIMDVHLYGSYKCTRAAWPHFLKQGSGKIINTASGSGIYGNFGQANYSAAKLGLQGFTNTLAKEGESKNIHCNTIAPLALTAMTEKLFPDELKTALKTDYIIPLVAALVHDSCKENGALFEVGAGYIGRVKFQRSQGIGFKVPFTPEDVLSNLPKINDFSGKNEYPTSLNDTIQTAYQEYEKNNITPKL